MFQSTLPHGERPLILYDMIEGTEVSIHAPTWGATIEETWKFKTFDVSIHAPTWGATVHSLYFSFTMSYNTIFAKEPNVIIYISLFLQFNI